MVFSPVATTTCIPTNSGSTHFACFFIDQTLSEWQSATEVEEMIQRFLIIVTRLSQMLPRRLVLYASCWVLYLHSYPPIRLTVPSRQDWGGSILT